MIKNNPSLLIKSVATLLFILVSYSVSANYCKPWSDEFINQTDLIIGSIDVNTGNVFDTTKSEESKLIHLASNMLHVTTTPKVISKQLLFKNGDSFKQRIIDETIRLIRSNRYIKDVKIKPYEVCGKKVKIKVNTVDKWTLSPGVSFGRSGGKNKSGIEIQENNLFGLGKGLTLKYKKNAERNETELRYTDPQLFGTKKQLLASINNNSDGNGYTFNLSLPHYSLDSKKTWESYNSSIAKENSIYSKGQVTDKINFTENSHSLFKGWSKGLKKGRVNRFKVGWNFTETQYQEFSPITQSYPWLEYETLQEKFITRTNFKSMGEIEDISLGLQFSFQVGLLNEALGSSDNHLRLANKISKGFEYKNSLSFVNSDFTSYLGKGKLKGERLNIKGEYFTFNERGSDLYFSGNFKINNNLQIGDQLLLGGETGLRGYPKGFQNGDKSLVLSAEKRFHFDWYPLQIAKFGAVVFADAGTAWGDGNKAELLSNIGFGLRMIPTRSSTAKVLHLDFAFPINSGKDVDNFQIMLKTKHNF